MNLKPVAALLLFACVLVFAQSAGGVAGISGVVRDASGAVVRNRKVVISSAGQGVARSLTTKHAGVLAEQGMIPGSGY